MMDHNAIYKAYADTENNQDLKTAKALFDADGNSN